MDEMYKNIKLKFVIDDNSYKEIKEKIEEAGENVELDFISQQAFDKFKKDLTAIQDKFGAFKDTFQITDILKSEKEKLILDDNISRLEKTAKVLKELGTKESLEAAKRIEKQLQKEKGFKIDTEELKNWGKDLVDRKLKDLGTWFLGRLKGLFTNAWEEMNNMLEYSKLTDSSIREQALTYGFSSSQNYAFSRAKELLGISRDEDLYYMDPSQQAKFYEKFTEYSDKYKKLYDQGFFKTLEEFNWERAEFEEDLQFAVIEFFMNNKETIKSALQAMINLAQWFLKAFGWLINGLGDQARSDSQRLAATQQIIEGSKSYNSSKNVSIDNTFNNVSQADRSYFGSSLALMKEQILQAL